MTEQTTDTIAVQIQPLDGMPDELLHIYPGQQAPQPCFIWFDLRDGHMWADWDAAIGSGTPYDVWLGQVRRYRIPPLQPKSVNDLMAKLQPFAQRVLDGSDIVWNGNNHVAQLTEDATEAEDDIDAIIEAEAVDQEPDVWWWSADDWLAPEAESIRQRFQGGETVDALYEEFQGDGSSGDAPVVIGLRERLEELQAEAQNDD